MKYITDNLYTAYNSLEELRADVTIEDYYTAADGSLMVFTKGDWLAVRTMTDEEYTNYLREEANKYVN